MPWRPFLEGADADAARAAIEAIAEELATIELGEGGLVYGAAGVALVHGYLARAGHPDAAERARAALARGFAWIDEGPPPPGLGRGFLGVAWAAHHLRDVVACDDATLEQIDEIIGDLIGAPSLGVDHWFGLVGFGAYALERGKRELAERVVAEIARRAEAVGDGIAWRLHDRPDRAPDGYFDVGMAHGAAGATAFLTAATAAGIARAAAPAAAAARWLVACFRPGELPRFPMRVGLDGTPEQLRNGWCYGDAPIAAALCAAGATLGQPDWIARGREVAHALAAAPIDHVASYDLGLCHGAAGRAHVLGHLAHVLDDDELRAAARRYHRDVLARVVVDRDAGPWLLTGRAGVALVLLGAGSPDEPAWDRVFLLAR